MLSHASNASTFIITSARTHTPLSGSLSQAPLQHVYSPMKHFFVHHVRHFGGIAAVIPLQHID